MYLSKLCSLQQQRESISIAWRMLMGAAVTGACSGACGDATADDAASARFSASTLERGRYLVHNVAVCPDCHTPRDELGAFVEGRELAGVECFARLPSGGCLHSRNLTPHETGLGNRSDAEIKRMIRDGVRPAVTGDEPLSPIMPYYVLHNLREDDLDAIVAYLRSVPAVEHAVPRSAAEFAVPAAAQPFDLERAPVPPLEHPERERALNGRYLAAGIGICLECHTRHVPGSPLVLDYDALFQGGEEYPQLGLPVTPVSANLTPDPQTGLGEWSVDEIVRAIQHGVDRAGDGICPPMPSGPGSAFAGLHDEDARDIALYLTTLPPAVHDVADECRWPLAP